MCCIKSFNIITHLPNICGACKFECFWIHVCWDRYIDNNRFDSDGSCLIEQKATATVRQNIFLVRDFLFKTLVKLLATKGEW